MEKVHSKKRDLSLLFMVGVIAATLLLTGCNSNASTSSHSGATSGASSSGIIPVAKADFEAGAFQPYSEAAYRKAISDNKKIFLDFHADWCAVCVKNAPVIKEVFNNSITDDVVGFKVDYDNERALGAELNVTSQATLILLQGSTELKRVMGPQSPETLADFFTI